jgi:WD40 repeat protein
MNDAERLQPSSAGAPNRAAESIRQLVARLEEEQRVRWQRGERVLVEVYLEQHPALRAEADGIVDLLYNEFLLRQKAGEAPRLEDYLVRFPQLASQLRDQFEVHGALHSADACHAAGSPVQTILSAHRSPPADAVDLPTVPGYEIVKELGRGGMGVVYLAWQQGLHRLAALKMLLAGASASPQELARFRTEAEAVARLQHPQIVQIYEVGHHDDCPYIALEYVDGGSLADKLAGTPLAARLAAQLMETLSRAMHYAHQRGIIHRDLKPANVLLTADGVPKITDFGLAKIRVGGGGVQTQSGAIVGTPSYMAPEQAWGKTKEVGSAADVYALGTILYEMLTGRPPFRAETPLETLLQVQAVEPVPPTRLQPKVPRDLETIALKCLQKEPPKRYRSAEALAEDLQRFLKGEPILARPVGRIERLGLWYRRNPVVASLLLVLVLVFFGGFAGVTWQWRQAVWQRRQTEHRLAENYLNRGLSLCEQGDTGRGLLWMARSLELAPADLQRAVRANLAIWHRRVNAKRAILEHSALEREVTAVSSRVKDKPSWHADSVVAFSPDGSRILTKNSVAVLWDAVSGEPIGSPLYDVERVEKFRKSQAEIQAARPSEGASGWFVTGLVGAAFSRDGRTILTAHDDGMIRVWDAATGKLTGRTTLTAWDNNVRFERKFVAFSPDGKIVLVESEGTARLWDAATGEVRGKPLQHRPLIQAAFSPDGQTVLIGSSDQTVRLWDAATGKLRGELLPHHGPVMAMAFSPDGTHFLTGSQDYTARLWDAATGKPIGTPLQHQQPVLAVAFSPDGRTVLTGSGGNAHGDTFAYTYRGEARLWDVTTLKPIGQPLEHRGVMAVTFSPDSRMVLTGDLEGVVHLWEAVVERPAGLSLPHQDMVVEAVFSHDGKRVLTGSSDDMLHGPKTFRLWDAATGRPVGPPFQHRVPPVDYTRMILSPDGKTVLTVFDQKTIQLWDAASGKRVGASFLHQDPIPFRCVAFSPDGSRLLSASGRTVRLWDAATAQPVGEPLSHQDNVRAAAFSPDGKIILTGSGIFEGDQNRGEARFWDAATGKPVGAPMPHRGCVLDVTFSPDGKTALTGTTRRVLIGRTKEGLESYDWESEVQLWDVVRGQPIGPPLHHQGHAAFSPDGSRLLTSGGTAARLWNAVTLKPIGSPLEHQAAVAFSPDGTTALTRSEGTARLWDAATGKPIGEPFQLQGSDRATVFSPDGRTVLMGSGDTARLWDVATGQQIGPTIRQQGRITAVAFSPDGETFLTGSEKAAQVWKLPAPVQGEPDRLVLWTQVLTGMELDDRGVVRVLDAKTWHERRKLLQERGGPPLVAEEPFARER